jgi:hypothetical protein
MAIRDLDPPDHGRGARTTRWGPLLARRADVNEVPSMSTFLTYLRDFPPNFFGIF